MNEIQAVDYIFDNIEQFRKKYAGFISKFEGMGIEPKMAEAMVITIAAKSKALADLMGK